MKLCVVSLLFCILFVSSYSNPVPENKPEEGTTNNVETKPEVAPEKRKEPEKEPSVSDLLQEIFFDDDKEPNSDDALEKDDKNSTAPNRQSIFDQFQDAIKPIGTFLQTNPVTQFFSGQLSTNNAAGDGQTSLMQQFQTQYDELQHQLSQFANNFVSAILTPTKKTEKEKPQKVEGNSAVPTTDDDTEKQDSSENREIPDDNKKDDATKLNDTEEQKNAVDATKESN